MPPLQAIYSLRVLDFSKGSSDDALNSFARSKGFKFSKMTAALRGSLS